jgi:hypothetical protein
VRLLALGLRRGEAPGVTYGPPLAAKRAEMRGAGARSDEARTSPRAFGMLAAFGAVDKLPAWAGMLLGVGVGAPLAYAAERWLPVWAAYAGVGAVLAGATVLAWSGKPVSRVEREPPEA